MSYPMIYEKIILVCTLYDIGVSVYLEQKKNKEKKKSIRSLLLLRSRRGRELSRVRWKSTEKHEQLYEYWKPDDIINEYMKYFYIRFKINHNEYPYKFKDTNIVRDNEDYFNIYKLKLRKYLNESKIDDNNSIDSMINGMDGFSGSGRISRPRDLERDAVEIKKHVISVNDQDFHRNIMRFYLV